MRSINPISCHFRAFFTLVLLCVHAVKACARLGTYDLKDCTLYTSCYPCPMCYGAIHWAKIPVCYYAAEATDAAAAGFDDKFIYDSIKETVTTRTGWAHGWRTRLVGLAWLLAALTGGGPLPALGFIYSITLSLPPSLSLSRPPEPFLWAKFRKTPQNQFRIFFLRPPNRPAPRPPPSPRFHTPPCVSLPLLGFTLLPVSGDGGKSPVYQRSIRGCRFGLSADVRPILSAGQGPRRGPAYSGKC